MRIEIGLFYGYNNPLQIANVTFDTAAIILTVALIVYVIYK